MILCNNQVNLRKSDVDLTRFNKTAFQGKRPRWQVDKEAIGLSKVQHF